MSDRCQALKKYSSFDFGVLPKTGIFRLPLFQITMVALLALCSTPGLADECDRITMLESYETTPVAPEGAICETFVGLARTKGISCFWSFSYRSNNAELFFRDAWLEVISCREGSSPLISDPVNHPDSYNLQELITERGTYRVSKKDKSQQNQTLVVVGFVNHK